MDFDSDLKTLLMLQLGDPQIYNKVNFKTMFDENQHFFFKYSDSIQLFILPVFSRRPK